MSFVVLSLLLASSVASAQHSEDFDDQVANDVTQIDPISDLTLGYAPTATWSFVQQAPGDYAYRIASYAGPPIDNLVDLGYISLAQADSLGPSRANSRLNSLYTDYITSVRVTNWTSVTQFALAAIDPTTGNGYVLGCDVTGCSINTLSGGGTVLTYQNGEPFTPDPGHEFQLVLSRIAGQNSGRVIDLTSHVTHGPFSMDGNLYFGGLAPTLAVQGMTRNDAVAADFDGFLAVENGTGDSDGDGMTDAYELFNEFDPVNPDENGNGRVDGQDDADSDGLGNAAESLTGTDPHDPDSDDDGLLDGDEIGTGTFASAPAISTTADSARSVFAADLDGDGDLDVLSASIDDNTIAWYENTDGAGAFGAKQVISTTAAAAASVFAADLDGDGDLDVLSASASDNTIAWYENTDGAGAFGAKQIITTTAASALSVFAADLDGDGDLDVLSASSIDNTIAWYENTDGAGAFGAKQIITTTAAAATSVFAADLDGDGDLDVLSASFSSTIAWYENVDGAGAFGAKQVITTTAEDATSVFAADLDGDGDLDVLSASAFDDTIAWYENADGAGAFGAKQVITTTADEATSVFAADLDGDGDLDVLSASASDDTIAWYENADGAGAFGAKQVITTTADYATSVFAADLDGDGDLDVLSASRFDDKIAWYRQLNTDPLDPDSDGDGLCDGNLTIGACVGNEVSAGTDPSDADTDGDGILDGLDPAPTTASPLIADDFDDGDALGWTEVANAGVTTHDMVVSQAYQIAADPTGNPLSPPRAGSDRLGTAELYADFAMSVDLVDLGSDPNAAFGVRARKQLATGNGYSLTYSSATDTLLIARLTDGVTTVLAYVSSIVLDPAKDYRLVFEGVGATLTGRLFELPDRTTPVATLEAIDATYESGVFGLFVLDASGTGNGSPSVRFDDFRLASRAAADTDGDGLEDVFEIAVSGTNPAIADTDGDGLGDADELWTRRFLTEPAISTTAANARAVFAADLDGDGDLDTISASELDDTIAWYENTDGSGTFGPKQVISTTADGARSVFAADLDGDGDVDVLAGSFFDDTVAWYENTDGSGTFGPKQVISTTADGVLSVFAADVDGDGDLDVLSASNNHDVVWYANTNGAGAFGAEQLVAPTTDGARSVVAADLDGDSDLDVLVTSYGNDAVAWYENTNGAGAFGPRQILSTSNLGAERAVAADVDGDGDLDVVAALLGVSQLVWYENTDAAGTFSTERPVAATPYSPTSLFAVDLEGDGDVDVISASIYDDTIAWYENIDGTGLFGAEQVVSTATGGVHSVFAADVDGNDTIDVLSAAVPNTIGWYRQISPTDPVDPDSDGDGLCDGNLTIGACIGNEVSAGTDPYYADTDGDLVSDGNEVAAGTDPNDALDSSVAQASPDSKTLAQDDSATSIDVLANDSDADGTPVFTIASTSQPANGSVVIDGDGLGLTYEPDPGYCNDGSPTDDFEYTLTPGGSVATVSVSVTCAGAPSVPVLPPVGFVFLIGALTALGVWQTRRD